MLPVEPLGTVFILAYAVIRLLLPPHHLVHDAGVALDELDHLVADVLVDVVRHGHAVAAVGLHAHGNVHGLQQTLRVDAAQDEAGLVQGLGALSRSADANRREGLPHAAEEARLLGQRAGVAHHAEGVGLQAVVVVEAQRFVADDALIELEAALLDALAAARVAAVQNGYVVLVGHGVHGIEQALEVSLGVDVLLAMC